MNKQIYKFILIFIFSCSQLSSFEWKDCWITAVEACNDQDYETAEKNFNLAISEMEKIEEDGYPHLYVDRQDFIFF